MAACWLVLACSITLAGHAADWPTYLHDFSRSGATAELLKYPLKLRWIHGAARESDPAWPDEAKRDEVNLGKPLRPRFSFDRANHVAIVGERVFVGSIHTHTVRALSIADGKPLWTFFTDGPVRMAPTVANERVFFGSDDGTVYSLIAETGAPAWKHTPAGKGNKLVPNDGRFVSPWAVRTGVAVEEGVAYFGAGLFPHEGVFLCALDATTGEVRNSSHWTKRFENLASFQGALLLSDKYVIVPGGRSTPWAFDRKTGALVSQFSYMYGGMGSFAVLAGSTLLYGPAGRGGALISEAGPDFRAVNAYIDANVAAVSVNRIALGSEHGVTLLERGSRRSIWSVKGTFPESVIITGDAAIVGGVGDVRALALLDGSELWKAEVPGRALGLAVAGGRLLVSNDRGQVLVFGK